MHLTKKIIKTQICKDLLGNFS